MSRSVVIALLFAVSSVAATRAQAQAQDGKALYDANCKRCHGVRGTPPQTMKKKFEKIATFDPAFITKHSTDSIVTVLTKGKNEDMKSFKDKLSHDEMVAIAKYVHELADKNKPTGN